MRKGRCGGKGLLSGRLRKARFGESLFIMLQNYGNKQKTKSASGKCAVQAT
ncbi:MAG: hypothetical protein NC350_00940 [Corallococcus sp.]|nr:hypothetical protein [Corallococcus sp.]